MTNLSKFPIGAKVSLRPYFDKMCAPKPSSYIGVVIDHLDGYLRIDAPACREAFKLPPLHFLLFPSEVTLARGFAVMSPAQRQEIAARGGRAVPASKRAFSVSHELAAEAGRLGGRSRN